MGTPEERCAARAVIVADAGSLLLMQAQEPVSGRCVWFTPGGGMEVNEDANTCLQRELREETGLTQAEIGPLIWRRQHTFMWDGRLIVQQEFFYLVKTEPFEPAMIDNPSPGEAASFRGFRWWRPEEIIASDDHFAPRKLGVHLRELLENGPPREPVDVGV